MRRRSTPAGLRLVLISTDLRSLTLCCVASSFHSTIFAASPRCHRLARPPTRIDRQPTFLTGRDNVRRVARFINSPRVDLLVKKEKKKKKKLRRNTASRLLYPMLIILVSSCSTLTTLPWIWPVFDEIDYSWNKSERKRRKREGWNDDKYRAFVKPIGLAEPH